MCVHVQLTECSLACHGRAFSAPFHGSYTAVQELPCCSTLPVCECVKNWKLRVSLTSPRAPGQCLLPCEVMPDWPAARQNICFRGGEMWMLGESTRAGAGSSCFWVLLPPCLPFSNPGGVYLQLKLPLTVATQLALAAGINTRTAVCEATG